MCYVPGPVLEADNIARTASHMALPSCSLLAGEANFIQVLQKKCQVTWDLGRCGISQEAKSVLGSENSLGKRGGEGEDGSFKGVKEFNVNVWA